MHTCDRCGWRLLEVMSAAAAAATAAGANGGMKLVMCFSE